MMQDILSDNYIRRFEYPEPLASCDIQELTLRCEEGYSGLLQVTNQGEGILNAEIFADSQRISFIPSEWKNNSQAVQFTIDTVGLAAGETLELVITISSNGGEVNIPVHLTITPPLLKADNGTLIDSLEKFYNYSKNNRDWAIQAFMSHRFYDWVKKIAPEYKNIYTKISVDPNKERAIDNFFVAMGLKETTQIIVINENIKIELSAGAGEKYNGTILIKKSDNGYAECSVDSKFDVPWLALSRKKVLNTDFTTDNIAYIPFSILTEKIPSTRNYITIEIVTDNQILPVIIFVKLKPLIKARLSQESFKLEDVGALIIENNIGREALCEISVADSWIRFDSKKYMISSYAEIPFHVKVTGFATGFGGFFQKPFLNTEISVKVVTDSVVIKQAVPVVLGNL